MVACVGVLCFVVYSVLFGCLGLFGGIGSVLFFSWLVGFAFMLPASVLIHVTYVWP